MKLFTDRIIRQTLPAVMIGTLGCASTLNAAPFTPFEARAMAMGGTGTASANVVSAPLYNPALLQQKKPENLHILLPAMGAVVNDEDELIDNIDYIQDRSMRRFSDLVDAINAGSPNTITGEPATAQNLANATQLLINDLANLNGDTIRADLGGAVVVAIPGNTLNMAFSYNVQASASATPTIAPGDLSLLSTLAADAADGTINPADYGGSLPDDNALESEGRAIAVAITDYGITFSTHLDTFLGDWQLGVTPKIQKVETFDYLAKVDPDTTEGFDDSDLDSGAYETSDSDFNLDIGLATTFGEKEQLTLGLVAKNIVEHSYDTSDYGAGKATGFDLVEMGKYRFTVPVRSQIRGAVSYASDKLTLAFDIDLKKNRGIAFDNDTRFAAAGAEWQLAKPVALRAGYRKNLIGSDVDDVASAGIGVNLGGFNLDLTALSSSAETGGALQLGFVF